MDFQRNVFCLLGLPFDAVDMAGAIRRVRQAAVHRERCVVATPNTNWIVSCLTDSHFRHEAISSDLSLVDGRPLVWLARLLGLPIRAPVPGSTLFEGLRRASGRQLSVYFFGGAEGAAGKACRHLRSESKGLTCAGSDAAGFGSLEDLSRDEVIERINASRADFLVVALGAKKGQAWIARNRGRLAVPLISHLGAVVNFVAGTVSRAPGWMQRSGLEWLWRIKEEPGLWTRYSRDGLMLLRLLGTRVLPYAWFLRRLGLADAQLTDGAVEEREERDQYVIRLSGACTQRNLERLRACYQRAAAAPTNVCVDLQAATYVDSAFVGLTVLLHGSQRQRGRGFSVVGAHGTVRRVLHYCCADFLFESPVEFSGRRAAEHDGMLMRRRAPAR